MEIELILNANIINIYKYVLITIVVGCSPDSGVQICQIF